MHIILGDGRRVHTEECIDIAYLLGDTCQCCDGSGIHAWSPAGYFNGASGPDSGEYTCIPCVGQGYFDMAQIAKQYPKTMAELRDEGWFHQPDGEC